MQLLQVDKKQPTIEEAEMGASSRFAHLSIASAPQQSIIENTHNAKVSNDTGEVAIGKSEEILKSLAEEKGGDNRDIE